MFYVTECGCVLLRLRPPLFAAEALQLYSCSKPEYVFHLVGEGALDPPRRPMTGPEIEAFLDRMNETLALGHRMHAMLGLLAGRGARPAPLHWAPTEDE